LAIAASSQRWMINTLKWLADFIGMVKSISDDLIGILQLLLEFVEISCVFHNFWHKEKSSDLAVLLHEHGSAP
jgi:hypothetical protein